MPALRSIYLIGILDIAICQRITARRGKECKHCQTGHARQDIAQHHSRYVQQHYPKHEQPFTL